MAKKLPPIHPGEVLREEFLIPMKLSAYAVAKACGVPRTRIERLLIREETPVTADTALRLAKALNTTPAFWMNIADALRSRNRARRTVRRDQEDRADRRGGRMRTMAELDGPI